MDKLNAIFCPESLAVVGASTTPNKVRTVGHSEIELSCRFDELETNRKK